MVVRRNFNPSVLYSANVKQSLSGTDRSNQVARKDLAYWLPRTAPLLDEGVSPVNSLAQLLTLPKAHVGHILSKLLPIYRQRRDPNGKRFTNASLIVKVEAWQRVIRQDLQKEYNRLVLTNPNTPVRTFNMFEDPELKILYDVLNDEMEISASMGLTSGVLKRARTIVRPSHLKQILDLWDLEKPRNVELVFAMTIMLQVGPRGGQELRNMTCSQFQAKFDREAGHF